MLAAEETMLLAYYKEDPWGDHRMDMGLGQIAQILFNQNVKQQDRKKLTDFMPFFRKKATVDENVDQKLKDRFSLLMGKK